jgi:hypothetical protein
VAVLASAAQPQNKSEENQAKNPNFRLLYNAIIQIIGKYLLSKTIYYTKIKHY